MALKYYPLNRVITNRYTKGDQFVLADGTRYTGRYYTTYNGESYTGVNPVLGTNQRLFSISTEKEQGRFRVDPQTGQVVPTTREAYRSLTTNSIEEESTSLQELKPYYPLPLEEDYSRGYFTRYFAKNVSGPGYIFEISKLDWSKIQNGQVPDTSLGYETADILWQLTGPLNNRRISQYQIQGGVFDTNKRVTEAEARTFRGLVEFIGGDYTKFARITP